jgi:transcriptional regulator with XRE-family HTH domain
VIKRAREYLSENLTQLLGERGTGSAAKEGKIDQKTVWRMQKGKNSPTLEKIEALAEQFGLQPWQMIAPNLGRRGITMDELSGPEGALVTCFRFLTPVAKERELKRLEALSRGLDAPNVAPDVADLERRLDAFSSPEARRAAVDAAMQALLDVMQGPARDEPKKELAPSAAKASARASQRTRKAQP